MTRPLASPLPVTCTVYPPVEALGSAALSRLADGRANAPTAEKALIIVEPPPQLSLVAIGAVTPAALIVSTGSASTPGRPKPVGGVAPKVGPTARTTSGSEPEKFKGPTTAPTVR